MKSAVRLAAALLFAFDASSVTARAQPFCLD